MHLTEQTQWKESFQELSLPGFPAAEQQIMYQVKAIQLLRTWFLWIVLKLELQIVLSSSWKWRVVSISSEPGFCSAVHGRLGKRTPPHASMQIPAHLIGGSVQDASLSKGGHIVRCPNGDTSENENDVINNEARTIGIRERVPSKQGMWSP